MFWRGFLFQRHQNVSVKKHRFWEKLLSFNQEKSLVKLHFFQKTANELWLPYVVMILNYLKSARKPTITLWSIKTSRLLMKKQTFCINTYQVCPNMTLNTFESFWLTISSFSMSILFKKIKKSSIMTVFINVYHSWGRMSNVLKIH